MIKKHINLLRKFNVGNSEEILPSKVKLELDSEKIFIKKLIKQFGSKFGETSSLEDFVDDYCYVKEKKTRIEIQNN